MKKINGSETLKDLNGKELKTDLNNVLTAADALAVILINTKGGNALKYYSLAQNLTTNKEIDVDAADYELIKTAVKGADIYNNLVLGQLLMLLKD